jgi:hypothetical protein
MRSRNIFKKALACGLAALALTAAANEADIVADAFDRDELGKKWHINNGEWKIVDGALRIKELKADKHAASGRWLVPSQDAAYSLRFRLSENCRAFHVGFDPARGELKKKGHLYSVIITPTTWRIMKHVDKSNPKQDPNQVLASAPAAFKAGAWYSLKILGRGDRVTASIEGIGELTASHPTFHVKKPTLVFRCVGDHVEIDDVTVTRP